MDTSTGSAISEDRVDAQVRKDVVNFLRDLANKLETDSLNPEETTQISEFFMKFQFVQSLFNDMEDGSSDQDIMKFMSLGWYVYSHLIPRTRKENSDEQKE